MGRNNNLYEILRQATAATSEPPKAVAPSPALDESPNLKDTATSTLTPPPSSSPKSPPTDMIEVKARLKVEAAPRVVAPPPPPPNAMRPSEPLPAPATNASNPGARVMTMTYNNAAFGLLIAMGVLFVAYSIGVRVGRGQAPQGAAPAITREPEPATVPVVNPPLFSIKLGEWSAKTDQARAAALAAAGELKNQMQKFAWTEARVVPEGSGADAKVLLLYGYYENRNADGARDTLSKLKGIKLGKDKEPTFGKTASFVQLPARR